MTLIDNIFTNCSLPTDSGIIISDISDHFPIFTKIRSFLTPNPNPSKNSICQLTHNNLTILKSNLAAADWSAVLNENDANKSFDMLMEIVNFHYTNSLTLYTCKTSNYKKTPRQPWITKSLLRSINRKNKLFYKYKSHPTETNKNQYKKYKNILTTILRHEKKLYYSNKFSTHYKDIKQTWKVINNILNSNHNTNKISKMKTDNIVEEDPRIIAEKFNNYFANIGPELARAVPLTQKPFHSFLHNPNQKFIIFCSH